MIVSLKDCQQYHSNCVSKSCLRFSLLYIIFSTQKRLVLLVRKLFSIFFKYWHVNFFFFPSKILFLQLLVCYIFLPAVFTLSVRIQLCNLLLLYSCLLLYFVWPSSSSPISTFAASSRVTCLV